MKRTLYFLSLIVAVIAIALLSGCSVIEAKIQKDVATITLPDVDNALAHAQHANNASGIKCWGWLSTTLHAAADAPTPDSAPQGFVGIATLLELGSEAQQNPTPAFSFPKPPRDVHDACAGLVLDDKLLLGKFGLTVGGAAMGVGNIATAAKLKAGASALRAEAAALGVHP